MSSKIHLTRGVLDLASRVHVMGILNVTPDSFSDGGLYFDKAKAVDRALELEAQGADILDVGGESARPGSEPISEQEELRRVMPVIEALLERTKLVLSIDTYKAKVAEEALAVGVDIVNDISGFRFDPRMPETVARNDAAAVLMHTKGRPKVMNVDRTYGDLIGEILAYLEESVRLAETAGVDPRKIVVDPGIGFGKTPEQDLLLHRRLRDFERLTKPVLFAPSRKSFLGAILGLPSHERVEGTIASCVVAVMNGARIVRIHDVEPVKRAMRFLDAYERGTPT